MKSNVIKQMMLLSLMLAMAGSTVAQVKIGENPNSINVGSILEMEASKKGILYPRVNISDVSQWTLDGTPPAGMTIYNTNITSGIGVYFWDGARWIKMSSVNYATNEYRINRKWIDEKEIYERVITYTHPSVASQFDLSTFFKLTSLEVRCV